MTKSKVLELINEYMNNENKANDLEYSDPRFKIYSERSSTAFAKLEGWLDDIQFIPGVFT